MRGPEIIAELKRLEVPHDVIGETIGRDRSAATKMLNGGRNIKEHEVERLAALVREWSEKALPRPANGSIPIVRIPEYDVRLSAGPGALIESEAPQVGVWEFSRRYLTEELKVNPANLAVVEVQGDSMEPTLRSGDRVLVDHSDRNPAKPGIYAVWDSNATVVKRVEQEPGSDPPMVVLISDNKNHRRYRVPAEVVHVIGRVVWFARRL